MKSLPAHWALVGVLAAGINVPLDAYGAELMSAIELDHWCVVLLEIIVEKVADEAPYFTSRRGTPAGCKVHGEGIIGADIEGLMWMSL